MKTAAVHVYIDDGAKDHRGEGRCAEAGCGLPRTNRVHELPDVSEQTAEHRRRVGED